MFKVRVNGLGKRFGLGLVEKVRTRLGQLRTKKPRVVERDRRRRVVRDHREET